MLGWQSALVAGVLLAIVLVRWELYFKKLAVKAKNMAKGLAGEKQWYCINLHTCDGKTRRYLDYFSVWQVGKKANWLDRRGAEVEIRSESFKVSEFRSGYLDATTVVTVGRDAFCHRMKLWVHKDHPDMYDLERIKVKIFMLEFEYTDTPVRMGMRIYPSDYLRVKVVPIPIV